MGGPFKPSVGLSGVFSADVQEDVFRHSVAQGRDLLFYRVVGSHARSSARPRMRLSEKRGAPTSTWAQLSTGKPGERSGEICNSECPEDYDPAYI